MTRYRVTTCAICLDDFSNGHVVEGSDVGECEGEGEVAVDGAGDGNGDGAGAGAGTGAAAGAGTGNGDPKRAMALPCAHIFCFGCIEEWAGRSNDAPKCPVCREPFGEDRASGGDDTEGEGGGSSGGGGSSSSQTRTRTTTRAHTHTRSWRSRPTYYRSSHHSRLLDRQFRLQRMHTLYPDAVDQSTLQALTVALGSDNFSSVNEIAMSRSTHITNTLAAMAASRARGSGGSESHSFGGGSSGGGSGGTF